MRVFSGVVFSQSAGSGLVRDFRLESLGAGAVSYLAFWERKLAPRCRVRREHWRAECAFEIAREVELRWPWVLAPYLMTEAVMHLVEILLPVTETVELRQEIQGLSADLIERFGGLTAFVRSPGDGAWVDAGKTEHEDVIVLEVMTTALDREWWRELRSRLEQRLNQKEIVIRSYAIERL